MNEVFNLSQEISLNLPSGQAVPSKAEVPFWAHDFLRCLVEPDNVWTFIAAAMSRCRGEAGSGETFGSLSEGQQGAGPRVSLCINHSKRQPRRAPLLQRMPWAPSHGSRPPPQLQPVSALSPSVTAQLCGGTETLPHRFVSQKTRTRSPEARAASSCAQP